MVLERVGSGDDLSAPEGVAMRRSATALVDRGLVKVSKRDGAWRAAITEFGRYYLEHDHHPDDPAFRDKTATGQESRPQRTRQTRPQRSERRESAGERRPPPRATAAVAAQRRAAATELIAKLEKTGQVVTPAPTPDEEDELRRVIGFAKRHELVPAGKRIETSRLYDRKLRIRLVECPHPNSKPVLNTPPIAVPEKVTQLHPLLASLSEPADVLGVSADSAPRALRIMHALLVEVERRGYEVGWSADTTQGVEIRIDGHVQTVTMEEEQVRKDVLPSVEELAAAKVYSWQRIRPQTSTVASGKLAISVTSKGTYRVQQRWADRMRWSLDDRLGDVLATVEAQAREKEQQRRAAEEERLQRQRAWEHAMESARTQFWRDRRAKSLLEQVENWELADKIRGYCRAAKLTGHAAAEWLAWARAYADEIDPTTGNITAPEDIEPGPDDLRPYLGRWSPYGPERR